MKASASPVSDHHHAEVVAVEHPVDGHGTGHAAALEFAGQHVGVTFAARGLAVVTRIDDFDAGDVDPEAVGALAYHLLVAEKNRLAEAVGLGGGCGAQGVVGIGLAEHHALVGGRAGLVVDATQHLVVNAHQVAQALGIFGPVRNRTAGHSALGGRAGNGGSHRRQKARVERLRQDVVTAEGELARIIGGVDNRGAPAPWPGRRWLAQRRVSSPR